MKTINYQTLYDSKLDNATYDAVKAFQLNTVNSDTSDLANSKLRDIEASVNSFFNSIATNFNMAGYNKDILRDFVPALVYTMYDGYYIYSPYINKLDTTKDHEIQTAPGATSKWKSDAEILAQNAPNAEDKTYHEGDKLSGLKPYIYYSCRYQRKSRGDDFVITYALDNYISIQGKINNKWVTDGGYLLDNIAGSDGSYTYRGIKISSNENMQKEYVYNSRANYTNEKNKIREYPYLKINGVKYYYDKDATESDGKWFSILNGDSLKQGKDNLFKKVDNSANEYYKEAVEFKKRIQNVYKINDLKPKDAVDKFGNPITFSNQNDIIFDFNGGNDSIEDQYSNFNVHRLEVIKYCIERELSIAITNYNDYSSATSVDFRMPKLKENEWEKIINNVSVISFLQGLSIGGKLYNGYSIITNNKNKEVVNEESIYIVANNEYHRPIESKLSAIVNSDGTSHGILNTDLEIKNIQIDDTTTYYYVPKGSMSNAVLGSYKSIVNLKDVKVSENIYDYMAKLKDTEPPGGERLASIYFTTLARERYGMYRTNVNPQKQKEKFK